MSTGPLATERIDARAIGPLIGLRVSASRTLLRPGPAWCALAGAVAGGATFGDGGALLRLAGVLVLADLAWGSVWVTAAAVDRTATSGSLWALPYVQVGSPADRLRGFFPEGRWHELLLGVGFTGGLAFLLGGPALVASALALVASVCVLGATYFGLVPSLAQAVLSVGLPWALGMSLTRPATLAAWSAFRPQQAEIIALALGVAFLLLNWGAQRACAALPGGVVSVLGGQGLVLFVLAGGHLPWTAAVTAAVLLPPTWFWLATRRGARGGGCTPGARLNAWAFSGPWWFAALMLAAFALR